MAQIIPSDISRLALGRKHAYELDTLDTLRRELPDDYSVFHNIHWSLEDGKRNRFGEIDFVVLDGSGKAVVIEQKNGDLVERKDGLMKAYRDKETNVGDQLRRSVDAIREKFKRQNTADKKIVLDYLVYIPEHRITNLNTPTLDNSRIVDALDKNGLARRIQKLFDPTDNENSERAKAVFNFFCKSYEIAPDVHAYKEAQARAYTRLSGGLIEVIDNLEMTPFRLCVKGVAGCGKSQAARHFFDKAVAQGKRPLLLCYNRQLNDCLRTSVRQEAGAVHTWNGLCDKFLKDQGYSLDFEKMHEDPQFWKKAEDQVLALKVPDSWRFDSVVVDEGQDFMPEWHEMLWCFMTDDADILWLEDPVQNLRETNPINAENFVVYNARENYRTPTSIATFIQETMPFEFKSGNDVPGMGVDVHAYDDPEQQKEIIDRVVKGLIKRKFSHDDIVILTCRGVNNSPFSEVEQIAGESVRRFVGYDDQGNQLLSPGKLYFESIYRFKGQQAPAVVLIDVDPDPNKEREQRVLFSGMTRATVSLDMVVNGNNSNNSVFLDYR